METIDEKEFSGFVSKVAKARKNKGLPDLHHYDLKQYCEALINGASLYQLTNSAECSTRFDLVYGENDTAIDPAPWKAFARNYLGLELVTNGDPRGAAFRLVTDESVGDSWGDRTHLCVPAIDAYQSLA